MTESTTVPACDHAIGAYFGSEECRGFLVLASDQDERKWIDSDFNFCPKCGERLKPFEYFGGLLNGEPVRNQAGHSASETTYSASFPRDYVLFGAREIIGPHGEAGLAYGDGQLSEGWRFKE